MLPTFTFSLFLCHFYVIFLIKEPRYCILAVFMLTYMSCVHAVAPLPEGNALMPHVRYILENRSNELCVGDVFEKLLTVAKTSSTPPVYDAAKKKIIMKALNVHLAVERVVINGLKLIASQLSTIGDTSFVYGMWCILHKHYRIKGLCTSCNFTNSGIHYLQIQTFSCCIEEHSRHSCHL